MFQSEIFIDKESKKPATQKEIIRTFEKAFNTNLSSYKDLKTKALTSKKRAEKGQTFLKELNAIQKKNIEELNNRD